MALAVFRACSFALAFVLLGGVTWAQPEVDALRMYLGTAGSTCTLHSGSGVPSNGLGTVCDIYVRTDSPYTVYSKTGASTWSAVVLLPGSSGLTTVGALTSGSIASGFGTINVGANSITGGAITGSTLTGSTSVTTPTLTASANLTLSPTGDIVLGPTGNDILPDTGYTKNLGALTNKYLTLHAAELWVETLVAQDTIATIGGRVLVGPTTTLTSDLSSGATSISVKHNNLQNNDTVYLEANGAIEFMLVTSSASGTGPYTYTVTRNLDGTGANTWTSGDAVLNTGNTGAGVMDLYSYNSFSPAAFSHVYNFNATGSVYSSNYAESALVPILGDGANNDVNDAIYFGSSGAAFYALTSQVLLPLSIGTGTLAFEFWNGSTWTALTGTGGAGFTTAGPGSLTWTNPQTGWTTTSVNGVSAYWIRIRVTSVGTGITAGQWRTLRRGSQAFGPTISGNVRTATGSTTNFNAISPRWAIGNLNGLYGYSSTVYGTAFGDPSATNVTVDATNGFRIRSGTTDKLVANTSGDLILTGNIYGTATSWASGTGYVLEYNSGSPRMRLGAPSSGNRFQWDGTNLTIKSGSLSIDASGIALDYPSSLDVSSAYRWTLPAGAGSGGRLGTFSYASATQQVAQLNNTYNGTGDLSGGLYNEIQAYHNPASGGSVHRSYVRTNASGSEGLLELVAGTYDISLTDFGYATFGQDLRIYQNNGSSTAIPYIRSDNNYLVIESRSTANGGNIFLGLDNNSIIVLGQGGGQTHIYTPHFVSNPPRWANSLTQSTVGSAGAASALPANPVAYLKIADAAGNVYVVPAYNP